MIFTKPINILRIVLTLLFVALFFYQQSRPDDSYCGDLGMGSLDELGWAFGLGIPSMILLVASKVVTRLFEKKNKNSRVFVIASIIFEILAWSGALLFLKGLYCL